MDANEQTEQLSRLLESGGPMYGVAPEVAGLLRLARDCQGLALPAPTVEQRVRIARRFGEARDGRPGLFAGMPLLSSPGLAQRLAAAALVVGLLGGGASYATGVTPLEAARGTGSFIHSVVVNLDPRDSGTPAPAVTPSATPQPSTPEPSPAATTAPPPASPSSSAAATQSGTPDDDDAPDEDDSGNSGRGSTNSGRGSDDDDTRTPEPGDDNGGDD